MEKVKVEDAVGMVLCHDVTEIIPNVKKGAIFKKGHIITESDLEKFFDIGKHHVYVWNLEKGYIHEEDAAKKMAQLSCGNNIIIHEAGEGKVDLVAAKDGIIKINKKALYKVNELENICFATIHGNKLINKGYLLGGCRVIPLVVEEKLLIEFENIINEYGKIINIVEIPKNRVGIITTGEEVKSGRIKDGFRSVLEQKAKETNSDIVGQVFTGDNKEEIKQAIMKFIEKGVDLVEVTGGMSVDPDDMTPTAIKECGGDIVTYGTPCLPGAMFMLAYINDIPVVGLPSCVMYVKRSIFDLAVPRILSGEKLTKKDFSIMAYGGLCQKCNICKYPNCGFGN